jgi:predicted ATPase/DNA-binding CsgD family transcriptional regulator
MLTLFNQKNNLPAALTSFVGRQKELAQIRQLLDSTRLLTLTGPGGSGKTRLALEAARTLPQRYPDGVWFIELAALSDPSLIIQTIVRTLGLLEQQDTPPLEALAVYWRDKKVLLILDNCEHLIDECAQIASGFLKSCHQLQILATSREALSIGGETSLLIPPLDLPAVDSQTQSAGSAEAVQLFRERVRAIHPDFEINPVNAAPVAQICRKLEGIPLALELAAARCRVLSVEQIASRLDDRFNLLKNSDRTATPRQQTLQTLIGWSYDLLSEVEKAVFRRLAIFAGSWDLAAAEAVCRGEYQAGNGVSIIETGEVLDVLEQLVNKSLVLADHSADTRYRMLETIRQYALEKLDESGELAVTHHRHAVYYLGLAEEARTRLTGPEQVYWLERLETEHDNLRAVLGWATAPETEQAGSSILPDPPEPYLVALRLGGALWRFWQLNIHLIEGARWLEKTIGLTEGRAAPVELKARGYHGLAVLLSTRDFERSLFYHQENLRLRQEMNDLAGMADALTGMGWVYFNYQRDLAKAHQYSQESEALARQLVDKWRIAAALNLRALLAIADQNPAASIPLIYEANRLFEEAGDTGSATTGIISLSSMMVLSRDYGAARNLFKEKLPLILQLKNKIALLVAIVHISALAGFEADVRGPGSARIGLRLMSASEGFATDWTLLAEPAFSKRIREPMLKALKAHMDEATYQEVVIQGKGMGFDHALELAQEILNWAPGYKPEVMETPLITSLPAGLSEREAEVLRLVAQGLSNPEIAEKLVLSRRTVEAHLRSIFNKLDVTSRAAATRFALKNNLA